ncbi:MAG: helix-turn-helix transcriptional regulator [Bdellovibrio sp.]
MGTSTISADDKKFLKRMGAKIKSMRQEKGWTLEEVEDHGWNNWQHLQKIESGKNITVVTLRKVAQLYKVPLATLLDGV